MTEVKKKYTMARCLRLIRIGLVLFFASIIPVMAYAADAAPQEKMEKPSGEAPKEESKASIAGSLETTGNFYTSYNEYYNRTRTEYRVYENVAFDATFTENWLLHFNSRVAYQSQKGGDVDNWLLNFYYGYLEYSSEKFSAQLGRIMDFDNLVYVYFDGLNLEGNIPIGDYRLTLDLYGGMIVKDDYLEYYRNPWTIRTFNSIDYRNMFIKQRIGDYIVGLKADFMGKNIGVFGVDYQLVLNGNSLAEHYASLNYESMFSKKIKLYGYCTVDLVGVMPSNLLTAAQINPLDLLSIVIEYEYYQPVFIKGSYFQANFETYGNQEASARLIFFISKLFTFDMKYGAIIYEGAGELGNEVSLNLEHRDLARFGLRCNYDMIIGPEGNLITLQAIVTRRIFIFDFLCGAGVQFYNDGKISDTLSPGYFGMIGADIRIIKSLVLSATGDIARNEEYAYNLRGNLSLKYFF